MEPQIRMKQEKDSVSLHLYTKSGDYLGIVCVWTNVFDGVQIVSIPSSEAKVKTYPKTKGVSPFLESRQFVRKATA